MDAKQEKELASIVLLASYISIFMKVVLVMFIAALVIANLPEKRTDGVDVQWPSTTRELPQFGPGNRITEDDPRWDCNTMGNHLCGRVGTTNER